MNALMPKETYDVLKFTLNIVGALFGLVGTWLMARRYAQQFIITALYALAWPLLFLFGKGSRVRDFVQATARSNRDLPDSVTDMTVGLILLFWAFLLQFVSFLLDLNH